MEGPLLDIGLLLARAKDRLVRLGVIPPLGGYERARRSYIFWSRRTRLLCDEGQGVKSSHPTAPGLDECLRIIRLDGDYAIMGMRNAMRRMDDLSEN